METQKILRWRCHTPNVLKEVMTNSQCAALKVPLSILARLLADVAERAAEINDEQLNSLMMRLTLYSAADPQSEDYNEQLVNKYCN